MKLRAMVVLVAMLGLTVGSLAASSEAAPTADVSIVEFAFMPRRVVVNTGDSVTWTNNGDLPHTTSAKGGVWDSGSLGSGDTFTRTFNASGRFQYRCNIHTDMKGIVLVRP